MLDVSTWIYEFIILSIPIQHIHPDHEDGSSGCNPEVIAFLEKSKEEASKLVWKDLQKLKNKN